MSWARLDDNFHDHRKVLGLPIAAVGLYTLCLTWAHRNTRTSSKPGHLPAALPVRFAGRDAAKLAAALVAAELWNPTDDGWLIHDFADYLPDDKTRTARSKAGSKGAARRWQTDGTLPSRSHDDATGLPSDPIAKNGSRVDAHREVLRTSPEPVPVPTTSDATDLTATIVGEWIDHCRRRPPEATIGRIGKTVRQMLGEGIDPDDIRRGTAEWQAKGLDPSVLPSVVNQVMNARPATSRGQSATDAQSRAAMQRALAREAAALP